MNNGYSVSNGKFGSADPEDRARAHTTNIVTPLVEFDKLAEQVKQARAKGPTYDGTWAVLECLINEVAALKAENASQRKLINELQQKS